MPIERLVALSVVDDAAYTKYREGMLPILKAHGGRFGYDFKIAEVLKSEVEAPINRVFTISFADEQAMDSFFTNEEYLEVRKRFFDGAVAAVTEIARYEK